jgi:hypothetical protein
VSNLANLSPAEIDALWAEAMQPAWANLHKANALFATAAKYERAGGHYVAQGQRYRDRGNVLLARSREIREQVEPPFLAEWDARGGWTRAYVVPDGHIHKETCCHTLYPTTVISWLPEQSGLTEEEIVARAGVHACTVCYPSAPVAELRAAEAAAKKAAQCPGSGEYAQDARGRRYARCPHCGTSQNVTSRGLFRAHKPAPVQS